MLCPKCRNELFVRGRGAGGEVDAVCVNPKCPDYQRVYEPAREIRPGETAR